MLVEFRAIGSSMLWEVTVGDLVFEFAWDAPLLVIERCIADAVNRAAR